MKFSMKSPILRVIAGVLCPPILVLDGVRYGGRGMAAAGRGITAAGEATEAKAIKAKAKVSAARERKLRQARLAAAKITLSLDSEAQRHSDALASLLETQGKVAAAMAAAIAKEESLHAAAIAELATMEARALPPVVEAVVTAPVAESATDGPNIDVEASVALALAKVEKSPAAKKVKEAKVAEAFAGVPALVNIQA